MVIENRNIKNFVGRNEPQQIFQNFLKQDKPLLNIHSDDKGGIGKTTLILKYQNTCQTDLCSRLIVHDELIDLYDIDFRTATGIMRFIAGAFQLDRTDFSSFFRILVDYEKESFSYEKKALFQQMERHFFDDFNLFSRRHKDKIIVIFIDSYEHICDHDETLLSRWIESTFLPKLPRNVKTVIAGRNPLKHFSREKTSDINLKPFNNSEIIEFWLYHFKVENQEELEDKLILSTEQLTLFAELTRGKPILMALFVDWFNRNDPDFSPDQVIERLSNINDSPTEQRNIFEKALVSRFSKIEAPINSTIAYMAFINRRMTKEILHFLFQHSDIPEYNNYTLNKCEQFLHQLKDFSFVKYKNNDIFLLHDEMQYLINKYYWDILEKDPDLFLRKKISNIMVAYYDEVFNEDLLNEHDQIIYHVEKFYYQIFADLPKAFSEFIKKFQKLLDNYQIYHIQLLLQEISQDKYYKNLSKEEQLQIDIYRMDWLNIQYQCLQVIDIFEHIEIDSEKSEILEKNLDIKLKAMPVIGEAYVWLNQFDKAIDYFTKAARTAKRKNNPFVEAWMKNWKAYALRRNGNFVKSETIFQKAIHRMIYEGKKIDHVISKEPYFIVRLANMYGNMNMKRYLGGYYEASIYGQIAISILKKQNNKRECARNLHSLGESLKFSNKLYHAYHSFHKALKLTHDPLIQARIHISIALLHCRHLDYIYIMEDFTLPRVREKVMSVFKELVDIEKAKSSLENADKLLQDSPHQFERNTLLFYQGLIHSLDKKWNEAIQCFEKCEKICKQISHINGHADACVEKMRCLYFANTLTWDQCLEFDTDLNNIGLNFHNVQAKKFHVMGNIQYDVYKETKKPDHFYKAIFYYVMACDYMHQFGKVRKGRYYNALRTLAHRLCMLRREDLPSLDILESVRDIWEEENEDFTEIDEFSSLLNELLDFTIFRKETTCLSKIEDKYHILHKKVNEDVQFGGEAQRMAPLYAQLLLQLGKDLKSFDPDYGINHIRDAYHLLGYAHYINNTMFMAHYFYRKALLVQKEDRNSLIYVRLLIRQTAPIFRREVFIKILEFSRKHNIRKEFKRFKKFLGNDLTTVSDDLNIAKKLLDLNKDNLIKENNDLYYQMLALLNFRLAEKQMVLDIDQTESIEKLYKDAIEISGKENRDISRCMKAIEGLITFYYLSNQYAQKKDVINQLYRHLRELNQQKYMPQVMAHAEISLGDYNFDQIKEVPTDVSIIREAFKHYLNAMNYYEVYSKMEMYECARLLIQRIGELPKQAAEIMLKDVYTPLGNLKPDGDESKKVFKLIEECLTIHGELL